MIKRVRTLTVVASALVALAACGSKAPSSDATNTPTASATSPAATSPAPTKPSAGGCSYPASGPAAKPVKVPSATPVAGITRATINTNRGVIAITLDPQHAPCTVNSFVSLVRQGYFDNTRCHRLTTTGIYVLQCGDPTGSGSGGPGYSFNDELVAAAQPKTCATGVCTYPAGTLAMANSGPNTNGSQFFLVYQDSPLAYSYTIFGQMSASGLKVVQQIAAHGSGNPDANGNTPPNETVTITKATAR